MPARALLPLLVAFVAAKLALDHASDPDLFWHVRLGLDMLEGGALPREVVGAWTLSGHPYLANDWLAELAMAALYAAGGFPLLLVGKAALAAMLGILVFRAALERSGGHAPAAGLATLAMIFVGASSFATRPVLAGMACLAGTLLAAERLARGDRRALIALPVLMAVWVNVHGSWPVGLAAVAAVAASALFPWRVGRLGPRDPRPGVGLSLAGLGLASLGVWLNPVGPAVLVRPLRMVGARARIAVFDEWAPVPWTDPSAWILVAAVLALAIACGLSRRRVAWPDLAVVGIAASAAFATALYHVAFAVLAAPFVAEQLAGRLAAEGFPNRRLNAMLAAVAAVGLLGVAGWSLTRWERDVARAMPVAVVDALERSPVARERGFNHFDWGGYLVFRGVPTYVDGRLEPFVEAGVFDRYLALERSGDVAALEGEGVRWALVKRGTVLAVALAVRPGWERAAFDEKAEFFVRPSLP